MLLKLIRLVEESIDDEEKIPIRVDYVEKREIDVENLEFLKKSATTPRYMLLAVDLYSSKVYIYPMRSRK